MHLLGTVPDGRLRLAAPPAYSAHGRGRRDLQGFSDWTSAADLRDRIAPGGEPAAEALLDLLHSLDLIEREGEPPRSEWHEWSPEAAFFHFATKNGVFPEDFEQRDRKLVEKASHHPQPEPTKRIEGPRMRCRNAALLAGTCNRR